MVKKLLCLLLAVILCCSLVACGKDTDNNQSAYNNTDKISTITNDRKNSNNTDEISVADVKNASQTDATLFDYEDVEGGISITGFNGNDEIVVVPQSIDGKSVVSIGRNAFINNSTIRGLKISDSIHTIGDSAFMNCVELEVFVSGTSLKKLDSFSFCACKKLRDVELNQGLESMIQCFGFAGISKIEIPSSVTEMFVPFCVPSLDCYVTIIGESGSYVEQYVNENGEEYHLKFQAK